MKVEINTQSYKEIFCIGEMATQANGSVLLQVNKTVLLATVCSDFMQDSNEDFLPLTVQYIEKSYASGKFPGGFIKRESKPSEYETLTSRIIDRTLRPLFPQGYNYPTQITVLVLSSDGITDLQVLALNAASAALFLSDIPIRQPAIGLRIGKVNGEYKINPSIQELQESTLDLFVSGVYKDILMIEMRSISSQENSSVLSGGYGVLGVDVVPQEIFHDANEVSEDELLHILEIAQKELNTLGELYTSSFEPYAKDNIAVNLKEELYSEVIYCFIKQHFLSQIEKAIQVMAKSERNDALNTLLLSIMNTDEVKKNEWTEDIVSAMLWKCKRECVRTMALKQKIRADGRGLKDVRPISIQTNILPMAHSSALFKRGETQALVIATLGGDSDAQSYELLNDKISQKERFMLHYNFPPFSVGEVGAIGTPGRRELGHGNLAKRALEPTIINKEAQTIRLVSEILESNGSSSMATVCGGSLALCAADIDISNLVAGVAMGLISHEEQYVILTDIMGLEDHDGDMDFKVAGTIKGITAMQMDIKLGGLSLHILKEALMQAKEARIHILNLMEQARKDIVVNYDILPASQIFFINPNKVVDVIGQAGKTIKDIIEKFGVAIDLNRDNGEVKVIGENKERVSGAKDYILQVVSADGGIQKVKIKDLYVPGEKYKGKVKKIVEFGAFVELPKGGDGLLHISKIVKRGESIQSVFQENDEIYVEIISINKNKIELGFLHKA